MKILLLTFFKLFILNSVFGNPAHLEIKDSLSKYTLLIEEVWPGAFPQYHMDMKPKKKERWRNRLDAMAIKVNKQMKELFSTYYHYDYRFIEHQDLNILYPKEEYPFAIVVDSYSSTTTHMTGNGQVVTSSATGAKFKLYHRIKRNYYQYGNLLIGIKRISTIKGKRLIKRLNKAS